MGVHAGPACQEHEIGHDRVKIVSNDFLEFFNAEGFTGFDKFFAGLGLVMIEEQCPESHQNKDRQEDRTKAYEN